MINETHTEMTTTRFETDKIYRTRFITDHNLTLDFEVVSRTAKTVKFADYNAGEFVTCRIKVWEGVETCYPLGRYSMAPILRATKAIS